MLHRTVSAASRRARLSRAVTSSTPSLVEALEGRRLLSASPVLNPRGFADPDDQISEARSVAVNASIGDSVSNTTDVDLYRVTLSAGQRILIDIDTQGTSLDSYLRVFNSSGTEVRSNDDAPAPGEALSLDSFIDFTAGSSGTFYIGVSNLGNYDYNQFSGEDFGGTGSAGAYTLNLSSNPPADPDDQISEAPAIAVGQTVSDSISNPTDVDLRRVFLSAGQRILIDIDTPGTSLDSYLRVFNSSGTQLRANDDTPAPGESPSLDSFIDFTAPSSGTYYIGVSSLGNSSYNPNTGGGDVSGSSGAYTLSVTAPVAADPDDQISEARTAVIGGAVSDTISVGTDVDMYRVFLSAGQRLQIDIDRPSGGSLDSYLRLFNASGTELRANDDGPTPGEAGSLESYIDFTATTSGTYYIGVSGFANAGYNAVTGAGDSPASTGAYTLRLTSPGDPDDQIAEARAVAVGGSISDTISVGTDVDMYRVFLAAGTRYTFDIDRASGSLDSYLRIFNSGGTQVAANDDGPTPGEPSSLESFISFVPTTTGTYYVGVSGFANTGYNAVTGAGDSSGSTGAYTLRVASAGDPDDQISEARAVLRGQSISDSIASAQDVDMFRIFLSAGQRLRIDVDSPSGGLDSYLRVFNSSGTQIRSNDDGPTPGEASSLEAFIDFTATTSGTYYIGVSGFANTGYNAVTGLGDVSGRTGSYTLRLS